MQDQRGLRTLGLAGTTETVLVVRVARTECHRLDSNSRHLLPRVLEFGKSQFEAVTDPVFVNICFLIRLGQPAFPVSCTL